MKNKIVLEADTHLIDTQARETMGQFWTKLETLNDRTKKHTREIKELEREIKRLKSGKKSS